METLTEIELIVKKENHTFVKITESEWPADAKGALRCAGQTEGWTNFLLCLKATKVVFALIFLFSKFIVIN